LKKKARKMKKTYEKIFQGKMKKKKLEKKSKKDYE